jgi:hypothetical protein
MARSTAARARVHFGMPEIVLVLLLATGAVARNRPGLSPRTRKLLRGGTLLVSLATIGFLWNRPWVIAFPTRLLAGDWPSWTTHLYWYILFGSLLLAFNRTGKNAYCPWTCPFGAAQDVIGLAGGARRRRIPSALLFTWVKRVLLWLAVLLGLLCPRAGRRELRVFAAFFRLSGTAFQFAILGVVLVTAVFVSRPFCGWVCPVDATEQIARQVRVRALRRLGREPTPRPAGRSRPGKPSRRGHLSWSSAACATVFTTAGLSAPPVLGHPRAARPGALPRGPLGRTSSGAPARFTVLPAPEGSRRSASSRARAYALRLSSKLPSRRLPRRSPPRAGSHAASAGRGVLVLLEVLTTGETQPRERREDPVARARDRRHQHSSR